MCSDHLTRLKTGAISIDSATSVARISAELEHKVIVGNVSTHLLQNGHTEQVKAAARNCLQRGAAVLSARLWGQHQHPRWPICR